jgi:uncharacterized protein
MATWFIDTGFAIALCVRRDKFHNKAALLASEIERTGTQLVTTHAVILEIGAALSKLDIRADSAVLMRSLLTDASVQVLSSDAVRMHKALGLFEQRPDKEWSLCDCTSFVVMQELGITQALSTDHHFDQAGFTALLLQDAVKH